MCLFHVAIFTSDQWIDVIVLSLWVKTHLINILVIIGVDICQNYILVSNVTIVCTSDDVDVDRASRTATDSNSTHRVFFKALKTIECYAGSCRGLLTSCIVPNNFVDNTISLWFLNEHWICWSCFFNSFIFFLSDSHISTCDFFIYLPLKCIANLTSFVYLPIRAISFATGRAYLSRRHLNEL